MSSKKLFRLSGVALAVALLTASLPSQAIDITTETQYNPQDYQNQQSITIKDDGSLIGSNDEDMSLNVYGLTIEEGGQISQAEVLNIQNGWFSNSGTVEKINSLVMTNQINNKSTGAISTTGDLSASRVENDGELDIGGKISSSSLENRGTLSAGSLGSQNERITFVNESGASATIKEGDANLHWLKNSGLLTVSDGNLSIQNSSAGEFVNNSGATITIQNGSLQVDTIANNQGTIKTHGLEGFEGGKVSIIGNSGKIEVVNDVTLYKLQNEGDLTVTQGDLTVELTDHTSFINQDGAKIDVKEGTLNAATIAANAGEISAKQLGTIENRTSIQGNTGQIKAETAYLKVLKNAGTVEVTGTTYFDGTVNINDGGEESASFTTNDLVVTEGSRVWSADDVKGSFIVNGELKLENDTVSTFDQEFSANSLLMNGSAKVQLHDNTKGAEITQVIFDGTTEDSLFQSYAGVDVGKATIKENSTAHFNTYRKESTDEIVLSIDSLKVAQGAQAQFDNSSMGDSATSVQLGEVSLADNSLLSNFSNPDKENSSAFNQFTIDKLSATNSTVFNAAGGEMQIGEMTGSSNTILVGDTKEHQITIGKNTSTGLTVSSSDSAYGNTMTSVDQGVADLAATVDLNANGAEGAEGMKVVIGANDMTGRVEAVYDAEGNKVSQTEEVNEKNRTLTAIANLPVVAWRAELNDLYKRMGDLRATPYKSGVWVRYNGGKFKWSDGDLENDFHMIQLGIDTMPTENNIRFGTAFSYTKGDADFNGGSADLDTYSLALYGTWLGDKGQYVDVIGRVASIKNDANARSLTGQGKAYDGKMDNTGLSLSAEAGWRFALPYNLFIEPQVEATYSYIDSDSFRYGDRKYELQSTDSFIARAGFMAGIQCPDNKGNVYVRASVVHDFLGETDVKVSNAHMSRTVSNDFGGTWGEFGIGANVSVSDNTYVYADVEHTTGGEIEEPWRVNFGVRYNF